MRLDTKFPVRFYRYCRDTNKNRKECREWVDREELTAVGNDIAGPGFNAFNCITLRLKKSFPSQEFNFDNLGDFQNALSQRDQVSYITSVLSPNVNCVRGKELRLKQENFFSSESVQNVVRELSKRDYL